MSTTAIYPPIDKATLIHEEQESAARELSWLLLSLYDTLLSLRTGLQECIALIQPAEPPSTLVLSSPRSEALKGYVTRVGDRIVKGDMQIKMYGLPPPRGLPAFRLRLAAPVASIASPTLNHKPPAPLNNKDISSTPSPLPPPSTSTSFDLPHPHHPAPQLNPTPQTSSTPSSPITTNITTSPTTPHRHIDHHRQFFPLSPTPGRFYLPQLTYLRTHLNNALQILTKPPLSQPPAAIALVTDTPYATLRLTASTTTHLNKLLKEIQLAKAALTAPNPKRTFPNTSTPASIFDPPLPPHLSFDLTIHESALVAELRTVEFLSPQHPSHSAHTDELTSTVRRGFASILHTFAAGVGVGGGGGPRPGLYEEVEKVVVWDGKGEVRVKDKVRVESQDPRLMAVMVKLGGLEHGIGVAMGGLEVVKRCMGVAEAVEGE